jgi:enamine deaminase RidA (YjgF/YER057c/UK114 family)
MSGFIKTFNTTLGPKAIGPYSTAKIFNGLMYVSGQIGIDPATSELVSDDVGLQTRRAMENVKLILEETKCSFEHVLKSTLFLKVKYQLGRPWMISLLSMQSTLSTSKTILQHAPVLQLPNYQRTPNSRSKLLSHIPTQLYDLFAINFIK